MCRGNGVVRSEYRDSSIVTSAGPNSPASTSWRSKTYIWQPKLNDLDQYHCGRSINQGEEGPESPYGRNEGRHGDAGEQAWRHTECPVTLKPDCGSPRPNRQGGTKPQYEANQVYNGEELLLSDPTSSIPAFP